MGFNFPLTFCFIKASSQSGMSYNYCLMSFSVVFIVLITNGSNFSLALIMYLFHRIVYSLIDFAWCLRFLSFGKGVFQWTVLHFKDI